MRAELPTAFSTLIVYWRIVEGNPFRSSFGDHAFYCKGISLSNRSHNHKVLLQTGTL